MKISTEYPPNYGDIVREIPAVSRRPGIVFTYGDTIHNPTSGMSLPPHLVAHEEAHQRQQGNDPAAWWREYLEDPGFRFRQELDAYRAQYQYLCKYYGRGERRRVLMHIAKDLASPMYGKIVASREEAAGLIKAPAKFGGVL